MTEQGSFFIPDSCQKSTALARTTHLGIGAHPDDLEIMALHGILACYDSDSHWFGGITCTNGSGSIRSGEWSDVDSTNLINHRRSEQNQAAAIGRYSFMSQLGFGSAQIRSTEIEALSQALLPLLSACQPEIIYTHNPADKHPTHIAVLVATLMAIRRLPQNERPLQLLGCEVWRTLDWVCDHQKVVLELNDDHGLGPQLISVYKSQIESGKHYDKAIEGRRRANATFFMPQERDLADQVTYAIDMSPLLQDDGLSLETFTKGFLDSFRQEVLTGLRKIHPQ